MLAEGQNSDSPLQWVVNDNVAKSARDVWPKVVAVVEYWRGLAKCKEPRQGRLVIIPAITIFACFSKN